MISICIPVYEMKGRGVEMLLELLRSIEMQAYTEYEIIVSDNSIGDNIQQFVTNYAPNGYITYVRNWQKDNPASNFNNAINHAKGDIIKPMCQDDYFIDPEALKKIAESCEGWVCCKSSDHTPYLNENKQRLIEGENTYGSPSAVAWKACDLRFDENLMWLMDCEFYSRLIDKYGQPKLLQDATIGIRHWEGQLTWTEGNSGRRITDLQYVQSKYVR